MTTHESCEQLTERQIRVAAIDTSSDRAGVALLDGDIVAVVGWNARRNHTVETLAQLDHLLRLTGIPLHLLDGVAVATGPGSFSALRVGLSIAKGLIFSLGVPLVGIPTTDAIAAHLRWTGKPVIAVMTAGRGRVVWQHYEDGESDGPHNTTIDELRAFASESDVLIASETDLPIGREVIVLPAGARAEQIARLGWSRINMGDRDNAAALEPIYAHGRRTQEAISP